MPLSSNSPFRISCAYAVIALAAVLGVIVARSVPPEFPSTPGLSSSVHAVSSHPQRPRFNCSGSEWSMLASTAGLLPPNAESAIGPAIGASFCALQTKGFRYNRPPPIA